MKNEVVSNTDVSVKLDAEFVKQFGEVVDKCGTEEDRYDMLEFMLQNKESVEKVSKELANCVPAQLFATMSEVFAEEPEQYAAINPVFAATLAEFWDNL